MEGNDELRFYMPMIDNNFKAMKEQLRDLTGKVGEVSAENSRIKEQNVELLRELANIKQELAIVKAMGNTSYIPIK